MAKKRKAVKKTERRYVPLLDTAERYCKHRVYGRYAFLPLDHPDFRMGDHCKAMTLKQAKASAKRLAKGSEKPVVICKLVPVQRVEP